MGPYSSYREFIQEMFKKNRHVKGYRSRMAAAMSCHSSYLSHVLSGESHLTPDQAAALSDFWNLSEWESECFLTQLNYERAGTEALKQKLQKRLDQLHSLKEHEVSPAPAKTELREDQVASLLSSWQMQAILIALIIPDLRQKDKLAQYFGFTDDIATAALDNLAKMGLAHFDGKEWATSPSDFMYRQHDLISKMHHMVLRTHANQLAFTKPLTSIHVSTILALSSSEHVRLRAKLFEVYREIEQSSREEKKPEDVFGIYIDFYKF